MGSEVRGSLSRCREVSTTKINFLDFSARYGTFLQKTGGFSQHRDNPPAGRCRRTKAQRTTAGRMADADAQVRLRQPAFTALGPFDEQHGIDVPGADTFYTSVIAWGRSRIIEERPVKRRVLEMLVEKYLETRREITDTMLDRTCIVAVEIGEITGKENKP
mgnify:CR=1 FL=1